MSIDEILLSGGGVALFMTLLQISPIKIDPWTALAKALGRAINAEVLSEVRDTRKRLDEHIKVDDEREADRYREIILDFNNELMRGLGHTEEDFVEVLTIIDKYESFCKDHPDYPNSRAVHAVANIEKNYDKRLEKGDFL